MTKGLSESTGVTFLPVNAATQFVPSSGKDCAARMRSLERGTMATRPSTPPKGQLPLLSGEGPVWSVCVCVCAELRQFGTPANNASEIYYR